MSINLQLPKLTDLKPRLTVVGVGGAGCNGINNMIAAGLTGVEYVAANTDAQSLAASSAEHRIQLGANLTEGLGAGAKPEIGQAAAEEAYDEIKSQIAGSHMVFIAAGMGGGTGTGAAAVVGRAAKELGVLSVGVVTRPFQFEGTRRMRIADAGIEELRKFVDTLIVIPNQNLFRIANEKTTFAEAFVLADQVLYSGVACIVDLIIKEGLINLDFADVRAIMSGMGSAMMGTGEASGERRAILAAEEAIANPLLDDVSLYGANGVLLSITGGPEMTLYEVDEAASRVRQEVDPEANIIVGATFDDSLEDRVRVSIVASGVHVADNAPGQSHGNVQAGAVPPPPPLLNPSQQAADNAPDPQSSDLQQRLTDAMQQVPPQSGAAAGNHANASQGVAQQPAPPARQTWQGPGDVIIEEGRSVGQTAQSVVNQMSASATSSGAATQGNSAQAFQPQAPAEMPRSQARMPDIKEFPEVGQKAYQARQQGQNGEQASGSATQRNAPAQSTSNSGKPGLFQRLAGIGRRGNESLEKNTQSQGVNVHTQHTNEGTEKPQQGGGEGTYNDAQAEQNLPKFFNQQRR